MLAQKMKWHLYKNFNIALSSCGVMILEEKFSDLRQISLNLKRDWNWYNTLILKIVIVRCNLKNVANNGTRKNNRWRPVELTTVRHIYSNNRKEEKRKLIGQEWEFVRNNLCCTYQTDEETITGEKGKK